MHHPVQAASAAQLASPRFAELIRIQRKLDRWELQHLREHAVDLAHRLEAAERRADDAERAAGFAAGRADMFADHNHELLDALAACDVRSGLSIDGRLELLQDAKADCLADPDPRADDWLEQSPETGHFPHDA